MRLSIKQIKAIEANNKREIKAVCPNANEQSGIYFFTRRENGFKYAYIGQAKHLLSRLANHLHCYDLYIDNSLRKHKFYNANNLTGWKLEVMYFPVDELDEKERYYINSYANGGFQVLNKTSGGQDGGKFGIGENKPSKGYRDGLKKGYTNAQRDVAKLFDKWLKIEYDKNKKLAVKAYIKFCEFIKGE